MNQVNFDALKHIKAPQDWLDKAAAIPGICVQKKRTFPIYRVAAAASLVLVSVIGLLVFFFYGNKKPIEIRPSSTETTVSATEAPGSSQELLPTLTIEAFLPTTPREAPTDQHGQPVTEVIPTEKRNSTATEPTTRVSPSQAATEHKPKPTQGTVKPTQGMPQPTSHSDAAYTADPTQTTAEPTASPKPTDTPVSQIPTEGISTVESSVSFFATFDASLLNEGETVYCIYSPVGYATGTNNSSVKQPAEYFITKNGTVYASCEVWIDEPVPAENSTYQYYFINERGHRLASGTKTV
ncbi:MAG: hypothetical protein IJG87_01555 [Ruminococcus sp.]|nr:hypothetical protein [Ruminococcus sp.]